MCPNSRNQQLKSRRTGLREGPLKQECKVMSKRSKNALTYGVYAQEVVLPWEMLKHLTIFMRNSAAI